MITEFFKESKVFTAVIIINDKLTFTRWTWQSLSATNSNGMYTKGVFLKGGIYVNGVDSNNHNNKTIYHFEYDNE